MRTTFPVHLILFDFITRTILGEEDIQSAEHVFPIFVLPSFLPIRYPVRTFPHSFLTLTLKNITLKYVMNEIFQMTHFRK